jgi:hypothetical protein
MNGGEKRRSADVLQQFDSGVEVTRRTSTGTVFTARDMHPTPESGGYRPIRGEADVEALAPWVRHVPHPSAGHLP